MSFCLSGDDTWHALSHGELSLNANFGYRGRARFNDASV